MRIPKIDICNYSCTPSFHANLLNPSQKFSKYSISASRVHWNPRCVELSLFHAIRCMTALWYRTPFSLQKLEIHCKVVYASQARLSSCCCMLHCIERLCSVHPLGYLERTLSNLLLLTVLIRRAFRGPSSFSDCQILWFCFICFQGITGTLQEMMKAVKCLNTLVIVWKNYL